eukprot:scaffold61617_cov70-Phaeocystis_antarctica.AAC.2
MKLSIHDAGATRRCIATSRSHEQRAAQTPHARRPTHPIERFRVPVLHPSPPNLLDQPAAR